MIARISSRSIRCSSCCSAAITCPPCAWSIRRYLAASTEFPFSVTIATDQVNKNLTAELKQEAPGILAWMIEGCLEWQRIRPRAPTKVVTDATDSYLESQDVLGEWLEECLERDFYGFVSSREAFNSWKPWADERHEYVGSEKTFVARLEDRGLLCKGRNKEQTRNGFEGWKLKQPSLPPQESMRLLLVFVLNETYGGNNGNGEDHKGAVLVSLSGEEQGAWLTENADHARGNEARWKGRNRGADVVGEGEETRPGAGRNTILGNAYGLCVQARSGRVTAYIHRPPRARFDCDIATSYA